VRIRCEYKFAETDELQYFYADLYVLVAWERDLRRKVTDGQGLGLEDWTYWLFAHLKETGAIPTTTVFMDWLAKNRPVHCQPSADVTDPNPTEGALSEGS